MWTGVVLPVRSVECVGPVYRFLAGWLIRLPWPSHGSGVCDAAKKREGGGRAKEELC